MGEHTPGPWKLKMVIGGAQIYKRLGLGKLNIALVNNDELPTETTANTKLILSAPDMYNALEQITEVASEGSLRSEVRLAKIIDIAVSILKNVRNYKSIWYSNGGDDGKEAVGNNRNNRGCIGR